MQISPINNNNQSFGAKIKISKKNIKLVDGKFKHYYKPYTTGAIEDIRPELEKIAKPIGKDSDVLDVKLEKVDIEREVNQGQDNFYCSWTNHYSKTTTTLKSKNKNVYKVVYDKELPNVNDPEVTEIDEAEGILECLEYFNKYYVGK